MHVGPTAGTGGAQAEVRTRERKEGVGAIALISAAAVRCRFVMGLKEPPKTATLFRCSSDGSSSSSAELAIALHPAALAAAPMRALRAARVVAKRNRESRIAGRRPPCKLWSPRSSWGELGATWGSWSYLSSKL